MSENNYSKMIAYRSPPQLTFAYLDQIIAFLNDELISQTHLMLNQVNAANEWDQTIITNQNLIENLSVNYEILIANVLACEEQCYANEIELNYLEMWCNELFPVLLIDNQLTENQQRLNLYNAIIKIKNELHFIDQDVHELCERVNNILKSNENTKIVSIMNCFVNLLIGANKNIEKSEESIQENYIYFDKLLQM